MPILPDFDAAEFERRAPIDNPFFPLPRGTIRSYAGSQRDPDTGELATESNDTFVTFESKIIEGVKTTVVRDTAYADGVLVEDTLDFYAQDTDGNVWYFGEVVNNYVYDDEGNYVETNDDGSWLAGLEGAQPGWIMRAEPGFGAGYFQEFAPGVAVDEAIVVGVDQEVEIGLGTFDGVLRTLETTALEPDIAEFKNYAPGIGVVLVEEDLGENGVAQLLIELQGTREVSREGAGWPRPALADADHRSRGLGRHGADNEGSSRGEGDDADIALADLVEGRAARGIGHGDEPEAADFASRRGSDAHVTLLGGVTGSDDAIGAYSFNLKTGKIGEGRILFASADGVQPGESIKVDLEGGEGIGLFIIEGGADLGVDLAEFEDGGLFFENFLTGRVAKLGDGLAPLVTDADGRALPIQALHALGNTGGFDFLNPSAGVHAVELESPAVRDRDHVELLGFEDRLATDPAYDGDFNDVVVAVSRNELAPATLSGLLDEFGGASQAIFLA